MKRALRVVAVVLVMLGGLLGWASLDRCGEWRTGPGGLLSVARASGGLRVGAAAVPFALPLPVTVGGYGPWRSEASTAPVPPAARATVVDVGGQRFGVVSLDVLLVGDALVAAIREGQTFPVWVVATHTHSGPGAYDERLMVQLAALGAHRDEVTTALASSARQAVSDATKALAPAVLRVGQGEMPNVRARTGSELERRLTHVRFETAAGAPVAQWVLMAAHPTLVPRRGGELDPDYPGRVTAALEAKGGVATVMQTAGGNASASLDLEAFSHAVVQEVAKVPTSSPLATLDIGYSAFEVQLPHPDGTRLVPSVLLPATENLLCARASMVAEVSAVRLGPLVLLSIPAEVTQAAAQRLVGATGAQVVSLANGYAGYVEHDELVRRGEGEAKRQYFPPEVVVRLAEGARMALDGAGPSTMTAVPR